MPGQTGRHRGRAGLAGVVSLVATLVPTVPVAAAQPDRPPAERARPSTPAAERTNDAGPAAPPEAPPHDDHTVLVRFAAETPAERRTAALARHGLVAVRPLPGTDFLEARTTGNRPIDAEAVAAVLDDDDAVAEAEPNHTRTIAAAPNDTYYRKGRQRYLETSRFPAAWDLTTGSASVTVAVVDTGVALGHPDLAPRLKPGYDFVGDDASADDDHGHGTMVAGVLGAVGNNTTGVTGAAWNVSILPVKVLDSRGVGTDADVAAGITWAVDNGASVVNLSLGGPTSGAALQQAVAYAVGKGVVVVAAAGNVDPGDPMPDELAAADTAPVRRFYPAGYSGVVGVAATDWSGNFAWFSNFGPFVDVAAPGIDVWTTVKGSGTAQNGSYFTASGTSFAAPLVAATAALVRTRYPSYTGAQVASRIRSGARDAGPPGFDPYYGVGVLDAAAALGVAKLPPVHPAADANGSPDRATPMGKEALDVISPEGDEDWFAFDVAQPGMTYVIVTRDVPPPLVTAWTGRKWSQERAESMDAVIELFGPDRRRLAEQNSNRGSENEKVGINVLTPGRHYARVTSAFGARSASTYKIEVSQSSTPQRFDLPQLFPIPVNARGAAVGDVTGDGRADMLFTAHRHDDPSFGNELWVFPTRRDGWHRAPVRYPISFGQEMGLDTGDLDGDGKADVAVAAADGVAILHQRNGVLAPAVKLASEIEPRQVVIRDIDGDGRRDMVVAGHTTVLMRNTTSGWTTVPIDSRWARAVEVGDVTGDLKPDVVVGVDGVVTVYRQNADGTFTPTSYQAGDEVAEPVWGIAIADFSGDGRNDVAVSAGTALTPTLFLRHQATDGRLAAAVPQHGPRTDGIDAADVDGDGRPDLVSGSGSHNGAWYWRNVDGTLVHQEPLSFWAGVSGLLPPQGIAVGDVTGDRRPEVLAADLTGGFTVLRQRSTTWPRPLPPFVRDWSVPDGATNVPTSTPLTVSFARDLDPASVTSSTVRLLNASGTVLPAPPSYDAATRTVTVRPDPPLAPDSSYRVVVTTGVRDTAGDRPSVEQSIRFRTTAPADTSPPDTFVVAGPAGVIDDHRPFSFAVMASEPGTRFECRITVATFAPCAPPIYWNGYQATFTFDVRAVDAAGNVDPTPARRTWTQRTADWPANDWSYDALPMEGQAGSLTGTLHGADALRWDPDNGGNATEANVWYRWTAPNASPIRVTTAGTQFDTTLGVYRRNATADGFVSVTENDDDGAALTSTVTFTPQAGVEYLVLVGSFFDEYAATEGDFVLRWFVPGSDTTPPQTSITSGPSPVSTARTATFRFSANEPGSWFECSLDGGRWTPCTSPTSYPALATGAHSFAVRASDPTGNVDATPATWSWRIPSYDEVVRADAPRAWWRLGEPAGASTARDATGQGYDAAYRTVGLGQPGAIAGDADRSVWFGSAEAAVDAGDRDGLDFDTSDFTVEAWVRTTHYTGVIAGKHDGRRRNWRLSIGYSAHGTVSMLIDDGSGLREFKGPAVTVSDGKWHHVAAVVDRDVGVRIYVDGAEQLAPGATTGSLANRAPFQIAHSYLSGEFMGELDEVAVYPSALSPDRVRTHWQSGASI